MKSIYNAALIPATNSKKIIMLSNQFVDIADQYLLGDKSLPHVTLCQFFASEYEIIEIWDKVCSALEKKTIDLVFEDFSCRTFNNAMFWVSLLPDNCDKLINMNCIVADIVKDPVSKSYKDYYPHMTLINTKYIEYKKIVEAISKSYEPIFDKFILSLGKSDDIGQYTETICKYDAVS